ncbi:MAG: DUF2254 family protein [Pyrinomonadaceae bacterium]
MAENIQNKLSRYKVSLKETTAAVRRAFEEFLLVPTCVIGGFLVLAFVSYVLDFRQFGTLAIFRQFLKSHVFADAQATSSLLGAIASGIITMTSITISLLLLAVQQSAGSMTSQVFDQFLRRRHNQFYFGFFIGLALFSLITLATVNEPYNPVFGGTIALLGTIAALYLLLILLYTTINQMRPVEIIEAIHDLILKARENQLHYISQTRSVSLYDGRVKLPVKAETHGFVTHIHFEKIEKAIGEIETEIVLLFSVGDYVTYQDTIAEVKAETNSDAKKIVECVRNAVNLERQRDISLDPAYGIQQLSMIAWTSISTAKSNPAPGLLTIFSLRDILSRWSVDKDDSIIEKTLPVVYNDNVFARLLEAFETFGIVATESMQHQNYIEVLHTFTKIFDRLNEDHKERVEDIILRILSALGDLVLTAELNKSLLDLAEKLKTSERIETANAIEKARKKLALSVGELNSRSTRVKS